MMLRVTEAIRLCGIIDDEWFTTVATARGTAVHAAIALHLRGDLDESSVHPEVAPRLESFRRFERESGIVFSETEVEVRSDALQLVGHFDGFGRWLNNDRIVDWKGGSPCRWHRIQTALYAMLYAHARGVATPRRGALYLQADGSAARWEPHEDRGDFELAVAVVTLAHFIRNGGHK